MPEMMQIKRKIVLVGSPAVGKTSLVRRFVKNSFDEKYLATVGFHVSSKKVFYPATNDHTNIELTMMIWDIMGQKEYELTPRKSFEGAKAAIIVCDLTRKATLDSLDELISRLFNITTNIPVLFLANKADLVDQFQFQISDLAEYGTAYNAPYFISSAKTGENVETAFRIIGNRILKEQGEMK